MMEPGKEGFVGGCTAKEPPAVEPFSAMLAGRGLSLVRAETRVLQVNTGYLCNLRCRHCHHEAGPERKEIMSRKTAEAVVAFARRFPFAVVDITGGAPELVPDLPYLIEELSLLTPRLILRSNLVVLQAGRAEALIELCAARGVVLVASFPSPNSGQTDAQRGAGVTGALVSMLKRLNEAGYGRPGSGLELDLVANPVGAFPPAEQSQTEEKFRRDLLRKWGVTFNRLFVFGNVPLGRFLAWLLESGNNDRYMRILAAGFNPCTLEGLMCRTQLSVSWDGYLYDCDFNLAAGRPILGRRTHVLDLSDLPPPGTPIAIGDYCYACTAGSGFT